MSIEKALADLTAAITLNTEVLQKVISTRGEISGATGKAEATAKAEKEEKAAKPVKADKEEKTTKRAAKVKPATEEDIRSEFGKFLADDGGDADERARRKEFVIGVLAKYGVRKATEVAEEDRLLAIQDLKGYSSAADEEDEDDLV